MTEQHPEEWGERRKRREEERQRRLAAEREAAIAASAATSVAATSTPRRAAQQAVVADPPVQPLSRRELRERAAAAAARAEAGTAPAPTPAAPTPPAPTPPAPPERPRSRRELRAATSETDVVPTVVPPALTGGIRRISPDGSLGGVEPTPTEILSAEVRADALRAQAARAQAEREDAARRGVERSQAQRAATQRADAERAARERAQRFAEQLAQQQDAATAIPVEHVGRPVRAPRIVTMEPDEVPRPGERTAPSTAAPAPWPSPAPTVPPAATPAAWPSPTPTAQPAARVAVPSASEAERQARERADELARQRAEEIARDRAELIESERLAHEGVLRAERERATAIRPVQEQPRAAEAPAEQAEEPLPIPHWANVPRPQTGPTPQPPGSEPVPVPRWSAIRRAAGPRQVPAAPVLEVPSGPPASTWSPAESTPVPAPAWPTAARPGLAAPAPLPAPESVLDPQEEVDDGPPARVYTWFHIAALAVVAFVLGLLIVMVLLQDNGQPTQQTSESVEVAVPGPLAPDALPLRLTGI